MKSTTLLAAVLATATTVLAQKPTATLLQEPSSFPRLNAITVQGCFDEPGELVFNATLLYNSKSSCVQDICFAGGFAVAGTTRGYDCYCGHKYPAKKAKVADSKCDVGCGGYDLQACGGATTYTIYNTGKSISVDTVGEDPLKKGGSGSQPDAAKTSQAPGPTVVVTQAPEPAKGPNTGAIAAGVVVGVLGVLGIAGGMFWFIRRKRNKEIEEEHRRTAANSYISGKHSSSGGSITDARMDPVMAQRRLSDGSIADNEDYSRKILRVTNA